MNWKRKLTGTGLLWLGLIPLGTAGAGGPGIVTTVGMLTDLVRVVTGAPERVKGLIGEGVDPHLYKPTRGDVVTLQGSDLIIYNGLKLEGKMAEILEGLGRRGKPTLAVSEAILEKGNFQAQAGDYGADPHLWMDVSAWSRGVGEIVAFLSREDPERAGIYRLNGTAYRKRLEDLDDYARKVLATIPENRRILVTAHDAFGYFGRAYGIEVRGIQGLSTESEAGIRDLQILLNEIIEREVPAIFVESSVSDKNVRALLEGARARGYDLELGGTLFSDAMGEPGTYLGTYEGMLDHNITTIARSLGGTAPARGLNGRLVD